MARYEIQRWVSGKGFAIRDHEEQVYIRDWQGNVSALSLGDQIDRCYRMNQLDNERKWEEHCDAMGVDPYPFGDDDPYAYQDDDYPGYEEDYQSARYGVDAVDYAGQQR